MKKFLLLLLVVAAGFGGWWWFRHQQTVTAQAAEQKPEFAAVVAAPFRVQVDATGRVIPEQEIEIKCKASGTIQTLPVEVSDPVQKGGLLLQLDPVDEKRSVAQAQVGLAQAEARLAQAKLNLTVAEQSLATETTRANANLTSAQAKLKDATAKAERTGQLFAKKMASPEDQETALLAQTQAAADLAAAQARCADLATLRSQIGLRQEDIKVAEQQVQASQLALDIATQRRDDTTVLAPIDGVVSELNVQVGQIIASGINNVGGGTTVLKLADLSRIYVMVSVDESDIGRVELGQPAEITVDAHPDILFPGKVVQVAAKGAVSANVVTFQVKVEVTGEHRKLLKPEMTANVAIEVVRRDSALLAPLTAVSHQRRAWYVELKKPDGTIDRREVTVGATDGEKIEILGGLQAGDEVQLRSSAKGRWTNERDANGKTAGEAPKRPPPPPEGHP